MKRSERWQDNKHFVGWLISMQYAYREKGKLKHHFAGDGMVLYMWEAWQASERSLRKRAKKARKKKHG